MSDSEGDFSDELLELAGASEKKRKKRQAAASKSSKRRKPDASKDVSFESDDTPESEEDQDDANPYPLEGKYKNEADRNQLMDLSEIEREGILAQRLEELQRLQDKRSLDQMVREQRGETDPDSIAKTAKRQHPVRGATKEKSRKLDELKAKRKAKDDKKRPKGGDSPKRERSDSPTDMEMSSEEEEDGQITKLEEEEERDRKLYGKPPAEEDAVGLDDLLKCWLSRDKIAKACMTPWFEDYVKGAYVRYLIGNDNKDPVYRICEIENLAADLVRPYKINDQPVNQNFELKHGKSSRVFPMDRASNAPPDQREFERWLRACRGDDVKAPAKRQLERKAAQLVKLTEQKMTESDLAKMLEKRRQLQQSGSNSSAAPTGALAAIERSRFQQMRTLALKRNDHTEVQELDLKLAEMTTGGANGTGPVAEEDALAKVNERNRRLHLEAVRKAEIAEAERKRQKRKLEAGLSRTGTPDLKIPDNALSRAGTPIGRKPVSRGGVLNGAPSVAALSGTESSLVDTATFDSSIVDSVDVDLGDF